MKLKHATTWLTQMSKLCSNFISHCSFNEHYVWVCVWHYSNCHTTISTSKYWCALIRSTNSESWKVLYLFCFFTLKISEIIRKILVIWKFISKAKEIHSTIIVNITARLSILENKSISLIEYRTFFPTTYIHLIAVGLTKSDACSKKQIKKLHTKWNALIYSHQARCVEWPH